jgi:DNA-binding MarR family transcriptional regulator
MLSVVAALAPARRGRLTTSRVPLVGYRWRVTSGEHKRGRHGLDEARLTAWRRLLDVGETVAAHVATELETATGLPLEWFETLLHIYETNEGRVQQQELGRYSRLSQSAVSRMVSKMQHVGLLRREQMPEDRRNLYILLTAAGRDALLRAAPIYNTAVQDHFGRWLSDRDASTLNATLEKVRTPTAEMRGDMELGRLDNVVSFGKTVLSVTSESVAVSDAIQVRSNLEDLVLMDAARHINTQGINELRAIVTRMSLLVEDPEQFFHADWELHRAITSHCRNTILRDVYLALLDIVESRVVKVMPTGELKQYIYERLATHARLVDAVASGDPAAARAAAQAHNINSEQASRYNTPITEGERTAGEVSVDR